MGKNFEKNRQIEESVLRGYIYMNESVKRTINSHRFVIVSIPNMKYLPMEGKRV